MLWFLLLLLLIIANIFLYHSNEKTGGSNNTSKEDTPNDDLKEYAWLTKYDWFTSQTLVTFNDLKSIPDIKHVGNLFNCHLGQRKLLLNEILFYTKYLPKGKATIIYSGSANGEHTPVILEMFPDIKIIMIDPHYHLMNYDYMYIYKRGMGNKSDILSLTKKKDTRSSVLKELVDMLNAKKCLDGSVHNALEEEDFGKIEDIKNIGKYDCRVFVIQDYMSRDLAKYLKGDIYISDIRTIWFNDYMGSPSAIDIIHNSALQLNVFHELNIPCHLKFVMPSFREEDTSVSRINELPPFIKEEIEFSKTYGIDFLDDYKKGKFTYYDGEIYLQPWAPTSSRESRLVITKPSIKTYDVKDYRGRFLYYNLKRKHAFVDTNEIFKGYDGCPDCALEQYILKEFIKLNPNYTLKELYLLLNKFTFWDIKSFKCSQHGFLTLQKDTFVFKYDIDYIDHEIKVYKRFNNMGMVKLH